MFCPNCKSMLVPKEGKRHCPKCDVDVVGGTHPQPVVTEPTRRELTVVEGNHPTLPIEEIECAKCKNGEAYWRIEQTRSADEPPTLIFRCTKCSYTWRQY
ncbi:MAG TPA: transcription factor S [Thermoplasmata archaeon]|nr:transcription factor S [Thermoplasmata archaeon]